MTEYIRKTLFMLMAVLAAGMLAVSCADDALDAPDAPDAENGEEGYITLYLHSAEHSTRATEAGVDSYNENLIKNVTLCLWPKSGDKSETDAPTYMQTFGSLDKNGTVTLRVPLTPELINTLFNQDSGQECMAFAAVNVDPGQAKTVAELRALTLDSKFASQQIQPQFAMDGTSTVKLSSTGTGAKAVGQIDVKRSASKVTLALNIDSEVTETVGSQVLTWTPNMKGVSVKMLSGVGISNLDPAPTPNMAAANYFNTPDDLTYDFGTEGGTADYPYVQTKPFYTYPNKWTDDRNERNRTYMVLSVPWTSDGGQTYRTCYYQVPVVPMSSTETVRNMSYHINLHVCMLGSFVPEDPIEVKPDYYVVDWGQEGIDVDIKDYRYLVVDNNDFVVNNESSITIPFYTSHKTVVRSAKMTFYRYNFSDEGTEFAVTVTDALNNNSAAKGDKQKVFTAEFNNSNNTLTVTHDLFVYQPYNSNNKIVDLTNGETKTTNHGKTQTISQVNKVLKNINYFRKTNVEEYSRVEFEVTVQHEDMTGDKFTETIRITQYPGMYITTVKNYVKPNATSFNYKGGQGSTYINGNYKSTATNYELGGGTKNGWMTSIGLSTDYLNWNPNLYLITITNLPPDTQYIIGDPRSYNINNYLANGSVNNKNTDAWPGEVVNKIQVVGFTTAKALYDGTKNRKLKYYYPTEESNRTKYYISPKFRICSSYGGTGNILDRQLSRRRAAAYQEMGYAAGRWRLPTYGEVEFVMKLAADMKIPRLFGRSTAPDWFYWCAQGAMRVPPKNATNNAPTLDTSIQNSQNERARFVYDEWYWGDQTLDKKAGVSPGSTQPMYDFTWGDRPMDNPNPNKK